MSRGYYRFVYYVRPKDHTKSLKPYQLRDGAAFSELSSLLKNQQFEYKGLLFNKPFHETAYQSIDYRFIHPDDLIVLCTRPPLHDEHYAARKQVNRSFSPLEKSIFEILDQYFEVCARERIRLSQKLSNHLPDAYKNRADIKFRQNFNKQDPNAHSNAAYKELRRFELKYSGEIPPEDERTAAYFLYHPAIWENGPGLMVAFGMGGTETMAWNYLIRHRFPDFLLEPCFAMVEISQITIPEVPVTLDFINAWHTELLLKVAL